MKKSSPQQLQQLLKSGQFDPEWYLRTYPDVSALGLNPAEHYLLYGCLMNRATSEKSGQAVTSVEIREEELVPTTDMLKHSRTSIEASELAKSDSLVEQCSEMPLATELAAQSWRDYTGSKAIPVGMEAPRVTVVMTAHNSAETIGNAVLSLLNQSWPNLEIIISDDYSSDNTWEILKELRRVSPKIIRINRLEANLGTYIGKNLAISQASGEFVLFQDSDDYSHPDRVLALVLPLIADPNLSATRSRYCRFHPETGRVIPIGELKSKLGLITLAVRRKLFDEIGYFDAVKRAGDEEWYQRLIHIRGREAIRDVDATLYIAELQQNSLAADLITLNANGTATQTISCERGRYVEIFQNRFKAAGRDASWFSKRFPPLPARALESYPPSVAAVPNISLPVFASVCSIPAREKQLKQVIDRLEPQTDHIFVYLDKYPEIPVFLLNRSDVSVWQSKDFNLDMRDNAKFLAYDRLKREHSEFYYVTCDDDLRYPPDYVRTLIDRLDRYDRKVVVGLHGVICEEQPTAYFTRRFLYHFISATLRESRLVNNLGTGTVAFHSSLFDRLDPLTWPEGGMVDILFSIEARRRHIPMLACDRQAGWLTETEMPNDNPTLFNEFSSIGEKEKRVVDVLLQEGTWGYQPILDAVAVQEPDLRARLCALLPKFAGLVTVRDVLHRLRG